jgi:hypothetical protein
MEYWEQESLRLGKEDAWQCNECPWWNAGLCELGLGDARSDHTEPGEYCRDREVLVRGTRMYLRCGSKTLVEHWARTLRLRRPARRPRAAKPDGEPVLGLEVDS